MKAKRCISEWENPDKTGLLFEKCPICDGYIYHRNKTKCKGEFVTEFGFYDRVLFFKCNCGQIVYYYG